MKQPLVIRFIKIQPAKIIFFQIYRLFIKLIKRGFLNQRYLKTNQTGGTTMKKILSYLTIALIIPVMSWGQATISGQVLLGVAGTTGYIPIAGAQVTLISGQGTQSSVVAYAVSDGSGNYSFSFSALGFMQVQVNAAGYTPNPSVTVVAINNDSATDTVNFTFTSSGTANAPGTSSIGGQITSGGIPVSSAQVILQRQATATSAWVPVDTIMADSNGVYLFSNILAAGPGTSANAYTVTVNAPGFNSYVSGDVFVGNNQVVVSDASLSAAALHSVAYGKNQILHFSTVGDRLALDLGVSNVARTVSIYGLTGTLQQRVTVAAGETHAFVPATFARGYLFQVK